MAHNLITVTPPPQIVTFGGIEAVTDDSFFPRARISFVLGAALVAKAALDEQTCRFICNMPVNYAYVLDTVFVTVSSATVADAGNYNLVANMRIIFDQDTSTNNVQEELVATASTGFGDAGVGSSLMYSRKPNSYNEVFADPTRGSAPEIRIYIFDEAAGATGALTGDIYLSLLQYDIRQIDQVRVNAPMPVGVR